MDDELVQEIRPLVSAGGSRSRWRDRLVVVGWTGALAAAVVIGVAGPRGGAQGGTSTADGARPAPTNRGALTGPTAPTDDPERSPRPISVVILKPAAPGDVITTARLVIRGTFAAPVRYVDVRLESRSQHTLEKFSYRPEVAPSAGRPVLFGTEFDLPALRPNGTMWVTIVGFNERGIPVDATRRRIEIGLLIDPETDVRRSPGVRPTGPSAGYAV